MQNSEITDFLAKPDNCLRIRAKSVAFTFKTALDIIFCAQNCRTVVCLPWESVSKAVVGSGSPHFLVIHSADPLGEGMDSHFKALPRGPGESLGDNFPASFVEGCRFRKRLS